MEILGYFVDCSEYRLFLYYDFMAHIYLFTAHSMMLSVAGTVLCRMVGWRIDKKFWKELIV
jgi:hypothetical protein